MLKSLPRMAVKVRNSVVTCTGREAHVVEGKCRAKLSLCHYAASFDQLGVASARQLVHLVVWVWCMLVYLLAADASAADATFSQCKTQKCNIA